MTDLWEPVGGVFWSIPPDERLLFLRWAIVLTFAVVAIALVAVRIARKCREPKWHLRQHVVEIGGALTLVYLVGITALTWGRIGTLGDMPLNEVGDFLAGAFGPVAFLWLVLGFLQQGEELKQGTEALLLQATELKNSVEQQSIMAAAATQQIDAQRQTLNMQLEETERTYRANFVFGCGFSSSSRQGVGILAETKIEIGVARAAAHSVEIVIDPPIGGVRVRKFAIVSADRPQAIPVKFLALQEETGSVLVSYEGADGKQREECFIYKTLVEHPWVEFKRAD